MILIVIFFRLFVFFSCAHYLQYVSGEGVCNKLVSIVFHLYVYLLYTYKMCKRKTLKRVHRQISFSLHPDDLSSQNDIYIIYPVYGKHHGVLVFAPVYRCRCAYFFFWTSTFIPILCGMTFVTRILLTRKIKSYLQSLS